MFDPITLTVAVVGVLIVLLIFGLRGTIYLCKPNEVLIFSGPTRRVADRLVRYRIIRGGLGYRVPLLERVDSLDLTNMIIDLMAEGAYSKGGVPLNVQAVANMKIASHEPYLNNAIERFLGKTRAEVMSIAKANLEGSLRGVLATLTPEEVNEDRNLFNERVVTEAHQDMEALGLVVDTLRIQNITDDKKYLDSIGRIRNAQLLSEARIAEAVAKADSVVRSAENLNREVESQIQAEILVAKADAEKRLAETLTRRDALVAEENAAVAALIAQAEADIHVQKARIEQIRRRLEADVIAPAKAECESMELRARADVAPIIEDGRARAEALSQLAASWESAGENARNIFLLQKLEPIVALLTQTIADTRIEKVTVIDSKLTGGSSSGGLEAGKLLVMAEQFKEVFGVDFVAKLQEMTSTGPRALQVEATPRTDEPVSGPPPKQA